MQTKDAFVNDDHFDPEEAMEAAVNKRKFLIKRHLKTTVSLRTVMMKKINRIICIYTYPSLVLFYYVGGL